MHRCSPAPSRGRWPTARAARARTARQLSLAISLQPQHRATLEQLVLDQQNPKSSNYHKYLSPQAFTDQFGASTDAVTAVRAFLQDAGIHVTGVAANRPHINATGTDRYGERHGHRRLGQQPERHRRAG
jgi:subtilase family serine protease